MTLTGDEQTRYRASCVPLADMMAKQLLNESAVLVLVAVMGVVVAVVGIVVLVPLYVHLYSCTLVLVLVILL